MNDNFSDSASFQIDEFYLDLQHDGSKLRNLSEEEIKQNPFPGLRPFKTSEQDLFYGRKEQTNELILKLAANNFVAVIGSSGTGKSSLVRAGLIPSLFGGNIAYKGSDWKIAVCRPGNDPVKNLAVALSSVKAGEDNRQKVIEENKTIEPLLRASSYGILDVKELLDDKSKSSKKQNLLVIIDQFEELFRFDRKELKTQNPLYENIEFDFVNLLLQCNSDLDNSIYVILTMRSEFLGECVKFRGLPEAINKSQYLVPQLKREQLTEVIKGPVKRAGKDIAPGLVEILINEIESEKLKENLDQLPILQHALMRSYARAFKSGVDNKEILYEHYESVGGMKGSLAQHAQEIFTNLKDKSDDNPPATQDAKNTLNRKQQVAKVIFQALTDSTSDQKGGRRPTELQNIYDILKAEAISAGENEIDEVINYFRDADTSFIMPPSNTKLYPGLMLDISHESLMRNWPDLKDWMKEEVQAADLYKRLNDNREQNDKDLDTYIGGILLRDLQQWKATGLYNAAWAARYQKTNPDRNSKGDKEALYVRNLNYLEQCQKKVDERKLRKEQKIREEQLEKERKLEAEQKEKERELKSKRNRLIATVSIFGAIISIFFGLYAYAQKTKASDAMEEKSLADKKLVQAEAQRKIEAANAEAAKRKIDLANAQAEAQRKIDLAKSESEAQRKIDLANAQAKVDLANALAETEKQKNDYFYERIPEILQLVNAPFYKSGLMDSARRDMFIDKLVKLKYKDHKIEEYDNLLKDLNTTIEIYNTAETNPNEGLLMAIKFDSTAKTYLSDSMLRYVATNYFLYTDDTTLLKEGLDYNNTKSVTAISGNRKLFAIKLDDTIKIFNINNEGLGFLKRIQVTPKPLYTDSKASYNEVTGPNTMIFLNEDSLVGLFNNKIYRISITNTGYDSVLIPDLVKENIYERYYTSTISPDGKKLAMDYKDYNVKIWDIANYYDTLRIAMEQADGFVDNISFSFDNNTIIVKQRDKYKVLNLAALKKNPSLLPRTYICAGFTPDNKYVMAQPRSGVLELRDLEKDSLISSVVFSDIGIDTFKNAAATSLVLSPDWKKLLIKTNTYKTYLFQRNDKGDIFQFGRKVTSKESESGHLVMLSYLNSYGIFLNDDNLLSLNSGNFYDSIRLWKKYDNVKTESQLNLLTARIAAVTNTEDDFGDLSIDVDTVSSVERLAAAGSMAIKKDEKYLQKQTLYDAKKIYRRLAALDSENYLRDYRRLSLNYFTYYADTVERINDLKRIAFLEENLLLSNPVDSVKQDLSSDYWNLSWYLLFNGGYDSAVYCAKRGFELNPESTGINTNLALGYLLNKQCEEAFAIYKEYKDKKYASDEREFNKAFLQDMDDLQTAGIIKQEDNIIYENVQKARRFLRGETATLDCKNP